MTLRVTLEIVPYGDEENKRVIEVFNISNCEQTDFNLFNYRIEDNRYKQFREDDVWVEHDRTDGAVALVIKALSQIEYQRKNHP